jgi:hypothetical protein
MSCVRGCGGVYRVIKIVADEMKEKFMLVALGVVYHVWIVLLSSGPFLN